MKKNNLIKLLDVELFTDAKNIVFYYKGQPLNQENECKKDKLIELKLAPTRHLEIGNSYAYQAYISNNLYRVLTNGGKELSEKQQRYLNMIMRNIKYDIISDEGRVALKVDELIIMEKALNVFGCQDGWTYDVGECDVDFKLI